MSKKILSFITAIMLFTFGFLSGCNEKITEPPSEILSDNSEESLISSEEISEESIISDSSLPASLEASKPESQASIVSSSSKASSKETSKVSSQASSVQTSISASSTIKVKNYFLAGSWNGYLVNDENFLMTLIPGSNKWYQGSVVLTKDNRDPNYDSHWYKVTEGNWNYAYGIDYYIKQPAPVKKDKNGIEIGLGSIWVDENLELTVIFDALNQIVYDNADGKTLPTP